MACQVWFAIDPEEEPNELRGERVEVDEDGDGAQELRWKLPHEEKWRVPCACSEPWSQQVIRTADEVLTILAEAALENEQIDKAMEAMGVAQNLQNEESVVVARGEGSKMVLMGLAQAARQGILAGISKTKVRYLGSRLTWNTAFAAGGEK